MNIIDKTTNPNKENFCFIPLESKADRIAIPTSPRLVSINQLVSANYLTSIVEKTSSWSNAFPVPRATQDNGSSAI